MSANYKSLPRVIASNLLILPPHIWVQILSALFSRTLFIMFCPYGERKYNKGSTTLKQITLIQMTTFGGGIERMKKCEEVSPEFSLHFHVVIQNKQSGGVNTLNPNNAIHNRNSSCKARM
jgi:hypothetical protein